MNPQQFAGLALKFLTRTTMSPKEREEFLLVEHTLLQIGRGELIVGAPKLPKAKKTEPAK